MIKNQSIINRYIQWKNINHNNDRTWHEWMEWKVMYEEGNENVPIGHKKWKILEYGEGTKKQKISLRNFCKPIN